MKFFWKVRGSVSIFLVLIMLPMFTYAGLIIDGSRISATRMAVSGAGDLAMNSALSEYDKIVHDVYGLFAMSSDTKELQKNVERYFNNTINNTGILEGSDSYTRSFINSIGSMFSTDDISFDNIVDTQAEKFSLVPVANSALANPAVLDRQIVEYMKFRGPVSIGTGLLTKLGCLGETSKQTTALEKKVDYEKKLDTVKDACESAYKEINEANSKIDDSKFKETGYLDKLEADIASAKSNIKYMTSYIVLYKSKFYPITAVKEDKNLKKDIKKDVEKYLKGNTYTDKSAKAVAAYEYLKNTIKSDIEYEVNDTEFKMKETDFSKELSDVYFRPVNLNNQKYFIKWTEKNSSKLNKIYTTLMVMDAYTEDFSQTAVNSYKNEAAAYGYYLAVMDSWEQRQKDIKELWKSEANDYGKKAAKILYEWYEKLEDIISELGEASTSLGAVLKKVSEMKDARETWNDSVDDLSDSDIKTNMKTDYNNSAKDINESEVEALKKRVDDIKKHFEEIKKKIESIKYFKKSVCDKNYESSKAYDKYQSGIKHNKDFEDLVMWDEDDYADDFVKNNYTNATVKSGIDPATFTKVSESDKFYAYLKRICSKSESKSEEDKKKKENAEANRKKLIDQGNEDGKNQADTSSIKTGNYVSNTGLTKEISDAIDSLASGKEQGSKTFSSKDINDKSDNNGMADDAKSNLSSVTKLLDGFANIGKTARDKVYLEEYFTEMFSCYTSNVDQEGNPKTPYSLNHQDMSTNKFYRSEVEYILWGKDNVNDNLNLTKGVIFGIRFALDAIFAFTNSTTRTPALSAATAIAGWTGFGVPIVQTVILLAWSLAEAAVDVSELCEGKAVCIYKSKDTWILGIGGLKKKAEEVTKKVAEKALGDIFDKLEDAASKGLDSAENSINEYIDETVDNLADSATSTITGAVEQLAMQIVGGGIDLTKEQVQNKVNSMLSDLKNNAKGDSFGDKAINKAVDIINSSSIGGQKINQFLADKIYSIYQDSKSKALNAITSSVNDMIKSLSSAITTPIKNGVTSLVSKAKEETIKMLGKAEEFTKEKAHDAIDSFMSKMGGSSSGGGGKTSVASAFTLTYKEYLKAFVMLNIIGNENAMLKRCAKLIQANVSQKESSFNISNAYTMVEVNAEVSIRTTFMNVPIATGVDKDGNTTYDLDFSRIGSNRQKVRYVGMISY